ncbi:MAG: glycosyltransferase [Polyangiaceae bacterium]|nr:glycosyltransferase [Polyangiaceae bacterium]
MTAPVRFVFLGLSLTSSWGNGHATTYRALLAALALRGHDVTFLERDVPWYASNRDLPNPPFARTRLYSSFEELRDVWADEVRHADVVVVGSYVPDGARVGAWVVATARGKTAFYDIDTPVTLRDLDAGRCTYLTPDLVGRYHVYLSFTGGPMLGELKARYGARSARPLYCSVDPAAHAPKACATAWELGYLGTYAVDRQPALERLLLEPARAWPSGRFVVAGSQYPDGLDWPANVGRIEHLAPREHRTFYAAQRFTLNVTRAEMARAGWSPSVRLFEAAACGTPIITDAWPGLEDFFVPGREILVARSPAEALRWLREITEQERDSIARRARARTLAEHTAAERAEALERYIDEISAGDAAFGARR